MLARDKGADDPDLVRGILGGAVPPVIRLSGLFEAYEAVQSASLSDLSPIQRKKWEAPKRRAIEDLIGVIGDKPLAEISRGDALDYREHRQQRVLVEDLDINTANKDFGHIARMLRIVNDQQRLGLEYVFAGLRIEGAQQQQRTAFLPEFIRGVILKPGALDGLNPEARAVVYLMAETGLRISEATNLSESTIRLDAAIPHIVVEPEGRRLKTPQSNREVPLVGVALAALKAFPAGFPRYRDKGASLSALVNKYLGQHGMRPTDNHSLYSLRHSFEDRLTAVETPEKVVATLMGHKWIRPRYGLGPTLALKLTWMSRIAFDVDAPTF